MVWGFIGAGNDSGSIVILLQCCFPFTVFVWFDVELPKCTLPSNFGVIRTLIGAETSIGNKGVLKHSNNRRCSWLFFSLLPVPMLVLFVRSTYTERAAFLHFHWLQ